MKGLILKDLLNIKRNLKSFLFVIAFYIVFSFMNKDTNFLSVMIILLSSMLSIGSFSSDNVAKWDKYALSLPVSKKDIVLSKYLLSLIFIISGTIISLILNTVISYYRNFLTTDLFFTNYLIFSISIIYMSILISLIYKFGVEKSRLLIFLVMIIPTALIFISSYLGIPLPSQDIIELLLKISPLIIIFTFYISFLISYKIYLNKEV